MLYINYVAVDLATQNPALDKEVYAQAYSTFGDGGGGYFVWKATSELPPGQTSNFGIWFDGPVSGGLWERQIFSLEYVNIRWFGAKEESGSSDTTLQIQRTINFASTRGFSVFIPKGNYLVNKVLLKSNIKIFGEGDLSILKFSTEAADSIFFVDTLNASTTNNIQNVRIFDLVFSCGNFNTFSEHKHFLNLNGVSNFQIERCFFKQFRGDGIYLGSGADLPPVTHNENIIIRDCRFDGVTKENRNAISILDCNHCLIENNYFVNTTKNTMPGAIDIEPNGPGINSDTASEIIKNIIIQNNNFYNIGGNVACCSLTFPANKNFSTPPSGIFFLNNFLENVYRGFAFAYQYIPATGIDTKLKCPYYIEGNVVKNATNEGFHLRGACQVQVSNNYLNSAYASIIGYLDPLDISTDININNNYFDKCGTDNGNGLKLFNCKRVQITSNTFNDCGTGSPGAGNAVDFGVNTTSDYIEIEQNCFLSPTSKTLVAIQKEVSHIFSNIRNNRFLLNQLNGLPNYFQFVNDNNFGLYSTSSTTTSVNIPHQMGVMPKWVSVQPQSSNVPGIINITVDISNIIVTFSTIPIGTLSLWWSVQV